MAIRVGTSGFSYKEWKRIFYPADLPESRFLSYYATRFDAVEIDSTFYRIPTPKALDAWTEAVPDDFRFAIKASQRITHRERLTVPSESLGYFLTLLERLGSRLGVVLYQLPPFFRQDLPRLEAFLGALPAATKSALEFRHVSWFADETYRLLEKHGVALCINDNDEFDCPPVLTAKHSYVRLRRDEYSPEQRAAWRARLLEFEAKGVEAFAFIKHKDNPEAPLIALDFARGLSQRRP
jgi:uncharacterized protein YecE (DUF72 family)